MFGKKKPIVVPAPQQGNPCQDCVAGMQVAPRQKKIRAFYGKVSNGIVPVAKPSQIVQLSPIVAPLTVVPYVSKEQPLFVYGDDDDNN